MPGTEMALSIGSLPPQISMHCIACDGGPGDVFELPVFGLDMEISAATLPRGYPRGRTRESVDPVAEGRGPSARSRRVRHHIYAGGDHDSSMQIHSTKPRYRQRRQGPLLTQADRIPTVMQMMQQMFQFRFFAWWWPGNDGLGDPA